MRVELAQHVNAFLTRSSSAEALCAEVFRTWDREHVTLDFSGVVQMTPSFAHTLFFNLLNRVNREELGRKVTIVGAEPHVAEAIEQAIVRKVERGGELTAYLSE